MSDGKVLEPVKHYRRIIDHYGCPLCGKTLGELSWGSSGQRTQFMYVDIGPTYYGTTVIADGKRVFKPCGCETPLLAPVGGS